MIYSFTHPGSGLGNQLHRLIAGKVLALDKGYEYSAIGREHFKGKSFMNIDFGELTPKDWTYDIDPGGRIWVDTKFDDTKEFLEGTNYFNPEYHFVEDNTIIDGEFQSIQYFGHRMKEIDEWLKVEPISILDDVCVIGFRGGEFYVFPELGLPKSYYEIGIDMMQQINPNMKFEVHTDDEVLAKQFFPNFKIVHDIGINWRSIRCAKYAIIANSSFFILPRLLNGGITIAPHFWARRNKGVWSRPDNWYNQFKYV